MLNNNSFICADCGDVLCRHSPGDGATWHEGECEACGETAAVTQVRDFGGVKSRAINKETK